MMKASGEPGAGGGKQAIRVAVAMLSGDTLCTDTAFALVNMGMWSLSRCYKDFRIVAFVNHKCSDVAHGRNCVVREILGMGQGITHILFVDSDMTFPVDTLARLLAHRRALVGIDACTRRPPYRRVARRTGALVEMGAGILLVEAQVFDKIAFPWFECRYREDGGRESEDFDFCQKALRAGAIPFLDEELSKQVGHLGMMEFTLEVADAARGSEQGGSKQPEGERRQGA